jgi:hypothetical protein
MRMANDRDQAIVRSAVSDAAGSLIGFVPSLGTREVFAFGEGVALPTRLRFKELAPQHIPHSQAITRANMDSAKGVDAGFLVSVVERWRGATMGNQTRMRPAIGGAAPESEFEDIEALASQEFGKVRNEAPLAPAPSPAAASIRKSATNPESFFFPVEEPKPSPFSRIRK